MTASMPRTIDFSVTGPISRTDLPGLCARVCALMDREAARTAFCDVSSVAADAVTVEALARLQLAARRYNCRVRLRGASDDLHDLVVLMGLEDVLPE
jgi:ABC-type transporter Mla MlaB component